PVNGYDGSEFIEVYNRSSVTAYNLQAAGWGFQQVIRPGSYLVSVRDPVAFCLAFDGSVPVAGQFLEDIFDYYLTERPFSPFRYQLNGADQILYEDLFPWPIVQAGVSMQLIDPARPVFRPGNW